MQTLELECPSCSELLELDVGFAGGVCRCSNCGTLMTVPDEAGGGRAERLSRPDRPDDPSSASSLLTDADLSDARAARPDSPTPRQRPSSRSTGKRSSKRTGRGKAKGKRGRSAGKGRVRAERIEAGDYRTASGKTIHIDRATDVPMAKQRRTGVRIATGVIFMGIILAIAAVAIVLVVVLAKPPSEEEIAQKKAEQEAVENANRPAFIYSSSANPLEIEYANALGLPMRDRTAIVVDASEASDRWREPLARILAGGMQGKQGNYALSLYAATPGGVEQFGRPMTKATAIDPDTLTTFMNGLLTHGQASVDNGIARALRDQPRTLILILGERDDYDIDAWGKRLAGKDDLVVHVVLIDGYSEELRRWTRKFNDGEYANPVSSDLQNWIEDAEEAEETQEAE